MLSPSLREMIKCRWREFRREPSAFYWVILMPVLWMLALGFAFSHPKPERYGVGLLPTQEKTAAVANTEKTLAEHPQIHLKQGSVEQLWQWYQRGEISMMVRLGANDAQFQLDPANPEAMRAKNLVDDLIQESAGRKNMVTTQIEPVKAQGGRYVDFLIPGLLGLSVMSSSLYGIGMTLVANRRENLLKRYLATPMRASEYIVSQMFGRLMVLSVEFAAIMICGFLVFGFHVYGSYPAYILLAVLGASCFTAIAMLCGSRTKSIPMMSAVANLIMLPMMFLSGVFFSKNNLPDWLRGIVDYLPLTLLNDGLRKVANEGQPISAVGLELTLLAVYTVIFTFAAKKMFRWY